MCQHTGIIPDKKSYFNILSLFQQVKKLKDAYDDLRYKKTDKTITTVTIP